jgi:hypothetical protein
MARAACVEGRSSSGAARAHARWVPPSRCPRNAAELHATKRTCVGALHVGRTLTRRMPSLKVAIAAGRAHCSGCCPYTDPHIGDVPARAAASAKSVMSAGAAHCMKYRGRAVLVTHVIRVDALQVPVLGRRWPWLSILASISGNR